MLPFQFFVCHAWMHITASCRHTPHAMHCSLPAPCQLFVMSTCTHAAASVMHGSTSQHHACNSSRRQASLWLTSPCIHSAPAMSLPWARSFFGRCLQATRGASCPAAGRSTSCCITSRPPPPATRPSPPRSPPRGLSRRLAAPSLRRVLMPSGLLSRPGAAGSAAVEASGAPPAAALDLARLRSSCRQLHPALCSAQAAVLFCCKVIRGSARPSHPSTTQPPHHRKHHSPTHPTSYRSPSAPVS